MKYIIICKMFYEINYYRYLYVIPIRVFSEKDFYMKLYFLGAPVFLKGTTFSFFHQTKHPGALIHGLKPF
jgi:hypothetical protein